MQKELLLTVRTRRDHGPDRQQDSPRHEQEAPTTTTARKLGNSEITEKQDAPHDEQDDPNHEPDPDLRADVPEFHRAALENTPVGDTGRGEARHAWRTWMGFRWVHAQ